MSEKGPKSPKTVEQNEELTELEKAKNSRWNEISAHLNHWFYKPDLDALAIALSVYVSHGVLENDPVWLFVVGTSGSGKTSIICNALSWLPSTMVVSDVSPASFISGRAVKEGGNSLLHKFPKIVNNNKAASKDEIRTQGVMVFKDFTSVLARKYETKQEILGVMREIYDGKYAPQKGTKTMSWSGKISVVAAVTSAIEEAQDIKKNMGERFVQVRWPREDGVATAEKAADQIDHPHILTKFKSLILDLVDPSSIPSKVNPPNNDRFSHLAELVAVLRSSPIRAKYSGQIIDVPEPEAPTRIMQAMKQIAIGHAKLFRRENLNERDILLGRRVGFDTIPMNKLRIINSIGSGALHSEIVKHSGLPGSSVSYLCEELVAMKVLMISIEGASSTYRFTDEFAKKKANAWEEQDYSNVLPFKK